jgi:hypothetical protein
MLALFPVSVAGIILDDRIITGAPAWLKPAKFAISTAIFTGTMVWLYRYIRIWPRFGRAMGWAMAGTLILEVAIVEIQAARGTTSHFNVGTPVDSLLFALMGVAIAVLWLASAGILVALFRQRFENPEWGWWLRLGMLVTVLGSAAGGMMVRPTAEQLEAIRAGHSVSTVGGHTVGNPDGGPGLVGVGWSTGHGDMRIPHFFGLHGLQVIPFIGWFAMRRRYRGSRAQTRAAFVATASYLAFTGILTWQALRGQSIVEPDGATLLALAVWLVVTVGTSISLTRRGKREDSSTAVRLPA